jgi:dipeptidyl aminopeptidase/acylaminoacyl peptidase
VSDWSQLLAEVRDVEIPATLRGRVFSQEAPPVVEPETRRARRVGACAIATIGTLLVVGLLILAAHSRRSTSQIEPGQPARHDSTIVFLRYQGHTDVAASDTLMISQAGRTRILLQRRERRFVEAALSPDRRYVAFIALPAVRGDGSPKVHAPITVQVVQTSGSARPRLVSTGLEASQLAWSPDSQSLAFTADSGHRQVTIFVARPGSGAQPVQITHQVGPGYDNGPSWSPDGRAIAFTRVTLAWHSMLVDVATQKTRPLPAGTEHRVFGPLWQPHGNLIAVYGHQTVLTTPTSTDLTPLARSFPYGSVPLGWSPDGRYLLLRANPKPSNTLGGGIEEPCTQLFAYDVERHSMAHVGCGYSAVWEPRVDRVAYLAPPGVRPATRPAIFARRLTTVSALGTDRHVLTTEAAGDSFPVRGP